MVEYNHLYIIMIVFTLVKVYHNSSNSSEYNKSITSYTPDLYKSEMLHSLIVFPLLYHDLPPVTQSMDIYHPIIQ